MHPLPAPFTNNILRNLVAENQQIHKSDCQLHSWRAQPTLVESVSSYKTLLIHRVSAVIMFWTFNVY